MDENQKAQLSSYITSQLQAGMPPDDIANQLRNTGWQEADIQAGFADAHMQLQPAPLQQPVPADTEAAQQPQTATLPEPAHRGKLKTGWLLFKQSLRILKNYPGLVKYPAISVGISILLMGIIIAAFVYDANATRALTYMYTGLDGKLEMEVTAAGYSIIVAFYLLTAFVTYFFATALSAHVLNLFKGQNANGNYIGVAGSKIGAIAVYTLINATVGFILQTIAERFKLIGVIISKILGALWSLATSFVVPIIADTSDNGVAAVKQSFGLFKATWGETVTSRVSMAGLAVIIYLLIVIPVFVVLMILLGGLLGFAGILLAFAIFMLSLIVFITIESAATQILNTGLYYYARYKVIPPAFDPELLASVFVKKKK